MRKATAISLALAFLLAIPLAIELVVSHYRRLLTCFCEIISVAKTTTGNS